MIHQQARKRLLTAMLGLLLSGAWAVPAEAGIVPWVWDTIFGPVGSIRARRVCNVGYGFRSRCNYGGMTYGGYSPCSPCGSGACGLSCGCGYTSGGYSCGSGLTGGSCLSGQCGVNFTPGATGSNLVPQQDSPPKSNSMSPRPTFKGGDSTGSGIPGGTNVEPNLDVRPNAAPGDFPSERAGESSIRDEGRRPKPSPLDRLKDEEGSNFRPAPLSAPGRVAIWSTKTTPERQSLREIGSRSVQVTRQAAFPNSKWEVVGERHEVAKK